MADDTHSRTATSDTVCPYCVQWRCVDHKVDDCDNLCDNFEPYWPDGSVATLTQDDACERCASTLRVMYAEQNGSDDPVRLHDCGKFHRPSEECP